MPIAPNALEAQARALLDLYAQAERQMLRRMARRLISGTGASIWAQRKYAELSAMRNELQHIVAALEKQASTLRGDLLSRAYDLGESTFSRDLRALGIARKLAVPDSRLHGLVAIESELNGRMSAFHRRILREANDGYRRIIGESVALASTGALSTREAVAQAMQRFARAGVSGFWDKNGRRWGMAEYAEMATRTGMMNAALAGYTADAQANGEDLVIITDHSDECPLCTPWENRVLSLTGAQRGRPDCAGTLSEARAAGLFHPNCLHSFSVYVPGLTIVGGGDRQTPEQNAQGYANRQKLRGMERSVRKWKRMQAAATTPEEERRCKAYVDRWQSEIRALTRDTGVPRGVGREGGRVKLSAAALKLKPLTVTENGRIIKYGISDSRWLKAGFQTDKKLAKHLEGHLNEFPGLAASEYIQRARELLAAKLSADVEGFIGRDGFVFKYRNSTNEFALGHFGGSISTFFKPKDGREYFVDQIKKYKP